MKARFKTWTVLMAVLVGLNIVMMGCSSGSRSSNNQGGGGTNPPPPPPPTAPGLNYAMAAIGTNANVATLPANNIVGLGFSLSATNGTVTVNSITVTATGTIDETGFGAATLIEDNTPQNGLADTAELNAPIATVTGGFTTNNGTVTFVPGTAISINAGQTRNFLVVIDGSALTPTPSSRAGIGIVGSTVDMQIAANSDIAATGSGALTPAGTFGTNYGPVTLGVHDHLLISEVATGPGTVSGGDSGEFIEIFNPTGQTFQLDNYHLTDVGNNGTGTEDFDYWQLATASTAPSKAFGPLASANSTDFHARFPAGQTIAPGEAIVVAFDGGTFLASMTAQGITVPNGTQIFVLRNAQAGQTQMLTWTGPAGTFNGLAAATGTPLQNTIGIRNAGEGITFFFYDGQAPPTGNGPFDLVIDIDVVWWGSASAQNAHNDKTGISVDGFDGTGVNVAAEQTAFNGETTAANQMLNTAAVPSAPNNSIERTNFAEGNEPATGGNGFNGDDEHGEVWNTTFQTAVPSPGTVGP